MASSSAWRRANAAGLVAALALSGGCGLKKSDAPSAPVAEWRTGRVEAANNARVSNSESPGARAAVGLLSGPVGLMIAVGTEKDLGTSAIWQYDIRDGAGVVRVQSFSVVKVGDCVRYAASAPADDVPVERLTPESCTPQK